LVGPLARPPFGALRTEVLMNVLSTLQTPAAVAPEEPLYEVVNGQKVELPPMSIYASSVTTELGGHMRLFAQTHQLGRVVIEGLFILDPVTDLRRRPDVAFVSAAKWPLDRLLPQVGDWQIVPDLAVEVLSPNDILHDVFAKMREYFRYGVQQVWLVLPVDQEIYLYDSPTTPRVLTAADELDGGTLLPGLRLPVGSLFEQAPAAAP
jgi:Uma2 family endonuclease